MELKSSAGTQKGRQRIGVWAVAGLLDLLYPVGNHCFNCGNSIITSEVQGLCPSCLEEIDFFSNYCPRCGRALDESGHPGRGKGRAEYCTGCKNNRFNFDQARSIAVYDGLFRNLILRFKYSGERELSIPLGELLAAYYHYYYASSGIDYIIAIPLHRQREEERGYNQAALLAERLQLRAGIPFLSGYLKRQKNSPRLYNLNPAQRRRVIRGCFQTERRGRLKGRTVLLLDDILTTGTTAAEASTVLKREAGAERVYVLTLGTGRARGVAGN